MVRLSPYSQKFDFEIALWMHYYIMFDAILLG